MKNIKITVLALCAIAAGCNKQAAIEENPWINNEALSVPVQLHTGAMQLSTKAGEISSLDGVEFGVFALGEEGKPQQVLFQDQLATPGTNCLPATVDANGMAILNTKEGTAYYPMYSTNNYSFYGFHVQDAAGVHTTVTKEDEDYTVEIPEYGLVDVLWNKAVATPVDEIEGFCAKYIRYIYKQGIQEQYLPKLDLAHRTAAFIFEVYAADQHAEETFAPSQGNVRVTEAVVKNIPETAKLVVVGENEGTIIGETGKTDRNADIPAAGIMPTVSGRRVGEFFLNPATIDDIEFELTVKQRAIENENNKYVITGEQIRKKFEENASFVDFQMSYRYTMKITLQSAEKIEISVSLAPWEDGFEDEVLVIE